MDLRNYETILIFNPELSPAEIETILNGCLASIEKAQGELIYKSEPLEKKFAYPIQKKMFGLYQILRFKAQPSVVAPLELFCKQNEGIYRFLTIKLTDQELAYQQEKDRKKTQQAISHEEKISKQSE